MTSTINIQRNARVIAADGEVGHVTHLIVDPQTKEVTHLVVGRDGTAYEVPLTAVQRVEGERVLLQGDRAAVGRRFERDRYHAVDEDDVRAETTRTAQRGGAPLQDADADEIQVGGIREAQPRQTDQPGRLQLREEHLRVTKQQEQVGGVQLGKRVVAHQQTVTVPVREERVVIDRTPVQGEAHPGELTGTDETVDVPVMRERVAVEKEAVVTEEVTVRTEAVERQERVQEIVRKEELVVEAEGDVNIAGDARRTTEWGRGQPRRP